ncbi:Cytosolic carboxypeptidase-like protein 5 (ATP/GTP-binding protein-like 5), partial [Durusdinium trenchii]
MVRWRDVQHIAEHPEDDGDLPPLVSHEPVLMSDSWSPEKGIEDEAQIATPREEERPSEASGEEEEEEDEDPEEILEVEEEEEEEQEHFDQDLPEDPLLPEPEGMPDGPWLAGEVEFFSDFDSGNLAGAQVARPNLSPEPLSKKDLRSADVQWAAEPDDRKILYEMLHNCSVRKEPHPKAKLITKKSAGARLYASCRVTLGGWQKLVDEDGWAQLGPGAAQCDESATAPELKRFTPMEDRPTSGESNDVNMGGYPTPAPATPAPAAPAPATPAPALPALPADSGVLCFEVTARADCAGTPFASEECQWFHFGIRGEVEKTRLRFHVLGLSRFRRLETTRMVSGQLLTDGLQPVFRYTSSNEGWQLVKGEIGMLRMPDGMIAFTFEHAMTRKLEKDQELYFALTFPYSLGRIYSHLQTVLPRFVQSGAYVNREELTKSLGGYPIELLTITERSNRSAQRLPLLPELSLDEQDRPWIFPGRRPIFISARVHPGETPASYMLEGLLDFLSSSCAAAKELLRRYVFFVIPVLNPDGVAQGHHRLDLRGENLNRVYGKATLEHHPSIFAAEQACLNVHQNQGGLRLYLDLHAHSNRRGGFLLGDTTAAEARLYGWALGRHCGIFEYAQSDFSESKRGTGKSAMVKLTGNPLCFTVECHYIRGHHSPFPFGPNAWRRMGASCLLALLELDFLAKPRRSLCPSLPAFHARYREGLWALRQLEGRQRDASLPHTADAAAYGAMEYWLGLLCAASAAVAYGVQYAPVKKYEIYDGITFQWFMCAGILMVGFLSSIVFGDFGMKDNECLLIVFGGALWALSNYLVLPLVKLLGIGLGFSLYHFVNLMVGYVVGRFGFFQMERLKGDLMVCDLGCSLILISFVVMVFVEGDSQRPRSQRVTILELPPAIFPIDHHYREMYQRWRQGEARGARDLPESFVIETAMAVRSTMFAHAALESGSNLKSVGGFGVVATQEELPLEGQNLVRPETLRPSHSPIVRSNSEPSLSAA